MKTKSFVQLKLLRSEVDSFWRLGEKGVLVKTPLKLRLYE